ncbi:MAG: RNA 2'-phosphotransferase [Planctomycetota bacterium]|jgi:putative RNA 2'-phosphotransferase
MQNVKLSKFLSYVLRHKPEKIGLELDGQGWASIDDLIECTCASGRTLDRALLMEVVRTNDKQRFAISDDGTRIRASQGHSIPVDLELEPSEPPELLFHGTADRFLDSILAKGIQPRNRQHVHLSLDHATAVKVGQRHGRPVVLEIEAKAMHSSGHPFFLSANNVWLALEVPPEFLSVLERDEI